MYIVLFVLIDTVQQGLIVSVILIVLCASSSHIVPVVWINLKLLILFNFPFCIFNPCWLLEASAGWILERVCWLVLGEKKDLQTFYSLFKLTWNIIPGDPDNVIPFSMMKAFLSLYLEDRGEKSFQEDLRVRKYVSFPIHSYLPCCKR